MSKPEFGRAASGIVTKAELDQRIAAQPTPRAELHLTPNGYEVQTVNTEQFKAYRDRIHHLRAQLNKAQDTLREDRPKALLRGRAKQDFDRER